MEEKCCRNCYYGIVRNSADKLRNGTMYCPIRCELNDRPKYMKADECCDKWENAQKEQNND